MTGSSSRTATISSMAGMGGLIKAFLLASAFVPVARANCWFDDNGNEICNGLSNSARAGIGIGIAVLVLVILLGVCYSRRRRIARVNQAYVTQSQQQAQYGAGGPPFVGGPGDYRGSYHNQGANGAYAPPYYANQPYPPPQGNYPPPQEPPPAFDGGKTGPQPPSYGV